MSFPSYNKDPNAVLDYRWDWSSWLAASEVISSHSAIVEAGITVDSSSNSTTAVTIWLSGGTEGQAYTVTARIVTNQGRTEDSSIRINVRQK
jgi:hypothetical protein